jgi:hypothetical protein
MKLSNPFSQNTRNLFLYEYSCWTCGRSDKGLELHHIKGRESNSPLNAYLICTECHSHANHSQEEEKEYLQTTMIFLLKQNYKFTNLDKEFLMKHRDKYL